MVEKDLIVCEGSFFLDGFDDRFNKCCLLPAGTIQIPDVTADSIGMCRGSVRHQFALPFGGCGLVYDDADFLPILDTQHLLNGP